MISSIFLVLIGILGGGEIILLAIVIILLFGAKRIPDLARGIGKGIKEFKDARNGVDPEEEKKKD